MHFLVIGGSGRTGRLVVEEALSRGHTVTALARSPASFPVDETKRAGLTIVRGTPLSRADVAAAFDASPPAATATAPASASGPVVATDDDPTDSRPEQSRRRRRRPDAVLVALNARRTSDSPLAAASPDTPPRLMADSVANVVAEVRERARGGGRGGRGRGSGLVGDDIGNDGNDDDDDDYGNTNEEEQQGRLPTTRVVVLSQWGAGSSRGSLGVVFRALFRWTNLRLGLADHDAVDAEMRQQTAAAAADAGVVVDDNYVLVRPVILTDGAAAAVRAYPDDGAGVVGLAPRITRASVARFMVVEACETDGFRGRSPVISN
ncbi:NAD(P)-binding protein [Xylariaceae sp. FL0804]|nr:NAD(P)-binding protein [Xylariaceae sp. FL0804]